MAGLRSGWAGGHPDVRVAIRLAGSENEEAISKKTEEATAQAAEAFAKVFAKSFAKPLS